MNNKINEKNKSVEFVSENRVENLKIKPLSIAKFFYDKGIEDIAIIQRLIYLVYCEILEKENLILFEEEWQAWISGPVVESVFYKMRSHPNRKELFEQTSSLSFLNENEKIAINHCEGLFNHYQKYANINEEYDFLQKARNEPWEMVRHNLNNDLERDKIKTTNIIITLLKKTVS